MSISTIPTIVRTVTVAVPVERAFQVFTESFHTWWPAAYHIGKAPIDKPVLECRAGGRWYEIGTDGSECDWGRVLDWDPPARVLLTWQINGEWAYDPDPDRASEVEVRFTADGPQSTVVELRHEHLDRLGPTGQAMHDAVSADDGWTDILSRFAGEC